MKNLEEKIRQLPTELQNQVENYVDSLLAKRKSIGKKRQFTFSWAGSLKDLGHQYTSVELQHKISQEYWGIVSFDSDFDRTDRGRKSPTQLLEEYR